MSHPREEFQPMFIKVDAKNGIVIRLNTWKDKSKVYIQGGYTPGEDHQGELLLDPCDEFENGLAFGKAVTIPPELLPKLIKMLQTFQQNDADYKKALPPTTTTKPATDKPTQPKANTPQQAGAQKKTKGTVLASNRVAQPAATGEEDENEDF